MMIPRQRRMLTVVAFAIGVILLWPPVNVQISPTETVLDYVWVFSGFKGSIDFPLLLAEVLSLCLVGVISYRVIGRGN
jgi:hypothetical protein